MDALAFFIDVSMASVGGRIGAHSLVLVQVGLRLFEEQVQRLADTSRVLTECCRGLLDLRSNIHGQVRQWFGNVHLVGDF